MDIVKKLHQRVQRLDQGIHDFEEMLNHEEVKIQWDVMEYIRRRIKDLNEKREEYLICIQAIRYLEGHLKKDEFQKIISIPKDAID